MNFLTSKKEPTIYIHSIHDPPCGRGLAPISDGPSHSVHSTRMASPWAVPRVRAAINSEGGASFRLLSVPRAGRIAHLATRKPDQDSSPAAIGRFSRATDKNGCADRLSTQRRSATTAVQADDNDDLVGRQRSHPVRRTSIPVTHSVVLLRLHVIISCCLPNFGRCQALRRRVDQLYSSKLHERFCSRCSCKPVSGSSDWFKVRIGRIFQNIFMSTSGRWHVITTAVLLGTHLSGMHSLTWSMSFPMRVSQTGSAVRCASFLDLAPKRSQHWPRLQQIE